MASLEARPRAICKMRNGHEIFGVALNGSRNRWLRPSTPDDAPAIIALMREVGLAPHVEPAHLQWKYWQARADWPGSRSFVLTDGRDLLAHGAVMPGTLRSGSSRAGAIHMIDWAARRDAVGAGVSLMKHVGCLTDFLFGIGGSAQTLKIMPLIGYQPCGVVTGYARPLAPLALLNRPSQPRWKRLPRLARGILWSMTAPSDVSPGWRTRRVGEDEVERIAALGSAATSDHAVLERSAAFLRHALACPIVPVELFALERFGRIHGYFLLSYAPGQARLADWWVDSQDSADWHALVHAAVRQAKEKGRFAELVVWASDPVQSRFLEDCGFHRRLTLPIYFRRSGRLEVPSDGVRVQMLDNDAFYLYFGRNELWV